jgi:1,4-alpha-glucan branching enzyme
MRRRRSTSTPPAPPRGGRPRGLATWSGPSVAGPAWSARNAELRVAAAGAGVSDRALRELLALQSSDWPFLRTRALAGDYPDERAAVHLAALDGDGGGDDVRNLAPHLCHAAFLEP